MNINKTEESYLDIFKNNIKSIKIGELTQEVITKLNINRNPCNIFISKDRIKHIEKHKSDFNSDKDFYNLIKNIPKIIKNPDYIGKHPKNNSIQYIKKFDNLVLLAIRIKPEGPLHCTTAFPISEIKLKNYINNNMLEKM